MKHKKNINIVEISKIRKSSKIRKIRKSSKRSKIRKRSKRSKKLNNKKWLGSIYDGGAAFAKGGFGCVFKPVLNCKKSELNSNPNYVSKLIDSRNAERE